MKNPKRLNNLYTPQMGDQAVRVMPLREERCIPIEPARTNYFTVYLIGSGTGVFWADTSRFAFESSSLLFFVPYQHIRILPDEPILGSIIQFHANFLCVETFHAEVGCSGVLFNDPQGIPVVTLDEQAKTEVSATIDRLSREQSERRLAYLELMLADLKVLLILATRLKTANPSIRSAKEGNPLHPVLLEFRELIETHYRTLHSPKEYAALLNITPKVLGNIVRENLGTTPTELIRGRILTHAKWQLLHTLTSVKEVARQVGFQDELYFSRLFKKATGYSPTFFREFETEIRGGSNLSMLSSEMSIPVTDAPTHNISRNQQSFD